LAAIPVDAWNGGAPVLITKIADGVCVELANDVGDGLRLTCRCEHTGNTAQCPEGKSMSHKQILVTGLLLLDFSLQALLGLVQCQRRQQGQRS
jgi:hypothetical protein